MNAVQDVALAVNPTSGRGRGARAGRVALERLRAAGLSVQPLEAASEPAARQAVARAVAAGVGAVVAVGGDGMVNLVLNALAGTGTSLGIVPAGTGNDIARMLALPLGPEAATARLVRALLAGPREALRIGQAVDIDAVRCTGGPLDPPHWFAGVLGAGFDAVVNERANRWHRPHGPARYPLAMVRELPVFRPRRYTLELDGRCEKVTAMLVAVGNGPSYGGGMRVCPDARPDDGLLDVVVVAELSRLALLRIFPQVYSGRHVRDRRVQVYRARRVLVDAADIVAYADGERIGPLPLTCEVVPGAVRVIGATPRPRPR